ncbi:MAG: DUF1573 domain-containing protein [Prevotella sp.]|nr:DUF1573 domain-containing protein [Prevotella sp.]
MTRKQLLIPLLTTLLTACPPTATAQKLVVESTTVDVGKTSFCTPVTAKFELRNKGSRHLNISSVKTSCGCTLADYPKKSIGAGDKFTISLTYDARMLGHFVKQAMVYSNGSKNPITLRMKGMVVSDWEDFSATYPYAFGLMLADANVIEFDDVNAGDHPEADIHIVNNGEETMTPNVLHLPPYLTALATPEKLLPGKKGKVTLMLDSDKLHDYGLTQTSIYLARQLGEKVSSNNEIPVSVVLLPKMEATDSNAPAMVLSADTLLFDARHKSNTITITNSGQSVLKISSLQMFTAGMKVTLGKRELQPQETTKLKVSIERHKLLAARSKPRVLMITNAPDHPKVVINIRVE